MSETIPEDVMRTARRVAVALGMAPGRSEGEATVIARAILAERAAERERCARVAEALATKRRAMEAASGYGPATARPGANAFWCEEIAAAIRAGEDDGRS